MAFPERKRGKVPGRDKVGGRAEPGRGSGTPGFVWVSGAASCMVGAPGVRPHPAPRSHGPWGSSSRCCGSSFPEGPAGPGPWGKRVNQGETEGGRGWREERKRKENDEGKKNKRKKQKEVEMRRSRETDRDSPGPGQRSERCFLEASGADHTGPLPPKEDSWGGGGAWGL